MREVRQGRGSDHHATQNQAFGALLFLYEQVLERPLGHVEALRARRPGLTFHRTQVGEPGVPATGFRDKNPVAGAPGSAFETDVLLLGKVNGHRLGRD